MAAAAALMPQTVRMALTICGIDDVNLFNGQTAAERMSDEMLNNTFATCIDKSDSDLKDDYDSLSALTIANGCICLTAGIK